MTSSNEPPLTRRQLREREREQERLATGMIASLEPRDDARQADGGGDGDADEATRFRPPADGIDDSTQPIGVVIPPVGGRLPDDGDGGDVAVDGDGEGFDDDVDDDDVADERGDGDGAAGASEASVAPPADALTRPAATRTPEHTMTRRELRALLADRSRAEETDDATTDARPVAAADDETTPSDGAAGVGSEVPASGEDSASIGTHQDGEDVARAAHNARMEESVAGGLPEEDGEPGSSAAAPSRRRGRPALRTLFGLGRRQGDAPPQIDAGHEAVPVTAADRTEATDAVAEVDRLAETDDERPDGESVAAVSAARDGRPGLGAGQPSAPMPPVFRASDRGADDGSDELEQTEASAGAVELTETDREDGGVSLHAVDPALVLPVQHDAQGASFGLTPDNTEVVEPEEQGQPVETIVSRSVSTSTSATNALILPSLPTTDPSGPLSSTGEIRLTGSIDLPRSVGSTGAHSRRYDTADIDRLLDEPDVPMTAPDMQPVRAKSAIASHTASRGMIAAPRARDSRLPVVLAITAGVLALAVVALIIVGVLTGLI